MLNKFLWQTTRLLMVLLFLLFNNHGGTWSPSLATTIDLQATISVTAPGDGGALVAEGDDFFTRVVADRKDMDEQLDLRWQHGISDISVSDGIWEGQAEQGSSLWVHFPGLDSTTAKTGPIGHLYPIDTARYDLLTLRMYSSVDNQLRVWVYPGFASEGSTGVARTLSVNAGWHTYAIDLGAGADWTGTVKGLRLYPTNNAPATIQFDWARLTGSTSLPTYTIRWNASGSTGTVTLYADDDSDSGNGYLMPIDSGINASDGQYDWAVGALPPGDYYIYADLSDGSGDYSDGPLTIVEAPWLHFTAPSTLSGDDYATTELNGPWDMNNDSDILGLDWTRCNIRNLSFSDGQMHATVDSAAWCAGSDPDGESFVYLNIDPGQPLDTDKYKYLTFRWYVEGEWPDSTDRLESNAGWVVRFHYFAAWPPATINTLRAAIIWEGWNTYQYDLSDPESLDVSDSGSPGWTGTKAALRFDFLEGTDPFDIHVDYVMLTADPTAQAGGDYDIEWTLQASDRPMTITLKYDDDQNPDNFVDTIAILAPGTGGGTPPPGPHFIYLPLVVKNYDPEAPTEDAYRWTIPSGLSGSYYIYAEVDDGLNVAGWYSEAPLVISP